MKFVISENTEKFKQILSLLDIVGRDTVLKISNGKLSMDVVSGGTTIITTKIEQDFFDEFLMDDTEEYAITIKDFILPFKKLKSPITVEYNNGDININGSNGKYSIPVIDDDVNTFPNIPEIVNKHTYEGIQYTSFKEAIEMAKSIGATALTIFGKDNKLMIKARNGRKYVETEFADIGSEFDGEVFLSIMLLNMFSLKIDADIKLNIENAKPLIANFLFDNVDCKVIVAPRVR